MSNDRKFIKTVFGDIPHGKKLQKEILFALKSHDAPSMAYGDIYDVVYRSKNGSIATGLQLEKQLHEALIILTDNGLISKHDNSYRYSLTGKGLENEKNSPIKALFNPNVRDGVMYTIIATILLYIAGAIYTYFKNKH